MRLPAFLYFLLPFLYLGIGVASAIQAPTILGRVCGVMLVSAASIIFTLRRKS